MFKRFQGFVIGCVVCFLLTGVVFSKTGTETIQALYNNIKIYVDGVKIETKDVNGNNVEPFIYNGTTYLPVRAVGEAIGKTVTWDGATQSVYLGEKPGDKAYLMEVCPPYEKSNCTEYTLSNGKSFQMSGKKYTNGFTVGDHYTTNSGHILFNLNGKYSSINLDLGRVDGTAEKDGAVRFFVDDKLVKEVDVKASSLCQNITIPLNYGMQLKIEIPSNDIFYPDPVTGFANIIVE